MQIFRGHTKTKQKQFYDKKRFPRSLEGRGGVVGNFNFRFKNVNEKYNF